MIELNIFNIGVWASYFLILLIIFFVFGLLTLLENRRKDRFLVEIDSIEQYNDWKKNDKFFGGKK